jgi:hypothetical protein
MKAAKKFLCIVRPRYKQLVISMEAFVDISKLSTEDLLYIFIQIFSGTNGTVYLRLKNCFLELPTLGRNFQP